jgi:hypothetical protein
MMRTGEVHVSRGGEIAYKLIEPQNFTGEGGWHCEVYCRLTGSFYVCMRGSVAKRGDDWDDIYLGTGFISSAALERFCELKNDIILMQPKEITSYSRN